MAAIKGIAAGGGVGISAPGGGLAARGAEFRLIESVASPCTASSMVSTRIARARWARNKTRLSTLTKVSANAIVTAICGTNGS